MGGFQKIFPVNALTAPGRIATMWCFPPNVEGEDHGFTSNAS